MHEMLVRSLGCAHSVCVTNACTTTTKYLNYNIYIFNYSVQHNSSRVWHNILSKQKNPKWINANIYVHYKLSHAWKVFDHSLLIPLNINAIWLTVQNNDQSTFKYAICTTFAFVLSQLATQWNNVLPATPLSSTTDQWWLQQYLT